MVHRRYHQSTENMIGNRLRPLISRLSLLYKRPMSNKTATKYENASKYINMDNTIRYQRYRRQRCKCYTQMQHCSLLRSRRRWSDYRVDAFTTQPRHLQRQVSDEAVPSEPIEVRSRGLCTCGSCVSSYGGCCLWAKFRCP